jgi:hypothetical protein
MLAHYASRTICVEDIFCPLLPENQAGRTENIRGFIQFLGFFHMILRRKGPFRYSFRIFVYFSLAYQLPRFIGLLIIVTCVLAAIAAIA